MVSLLFFLQGSCSVLLLRVRSSRNRGIQLLTMAVGLDHTVNETAPNQNNNTEHEDGQGNGNPWGRGENVREWA